MNAKFQYFDGRRFTRDESTGYYLCSTKSPDGKRKRMHVYVWEYYHGPVLEGCHIHHVDGDKSNNDIENLAMMNKSEHEILHGSLLNENERERRRGNIKKNVAPRAKKWHSSEAGKKWHKEHYNAMKEKLYISQEFICSYCGNKFESTQVNSKFCSNKCKAAWRRSSGLDDIVKNCTICGGEYTANKYQKTKYCPICKSKVRSGKWVR